MRPAAVQPFSEAPLPPAWDLLLACVRSAPSSADMLRVTEALVRTRRLDQLTELALEQDLGPLVFSNIREWTGSSAHTHPALKRLHAAYAANAIRNELLFNELAMTLDCFGDRAPRTILLKGIALAATAYRNRALRAMGDIDLLVPEGPEWGRLLGSLGYSSQDRDGGGGPPADRRGQATYRRRIRNVLSVNIDLHTKIDQPSAAWRIEQVGLFARAIPLTIGGRTAAALCAEDTILHVCLHACKHRLEAALRSLCDIAAIASRYRESLDWPALVRRAKTWNVESLVFVPLTLARRLVDAAIPDNVLVELQTDRLPADLCEAALSRVFEDRRAAPVFDDLSKLRFGGPAGGRASVVKRILSPEVVARRYSTPAGSLRVIRHYPRRLVHLLERYGSDGWRFVRESRRMAARAAARARIAQWLAPYYPAQASPALPALTEEDECDSRHG